MAEYASRGVGNAGLATGIIGSAGWLVSGGLRSLLGGGEISSEDKPVSRYELGQEQTIASQAARISLLEANTYNDSKMLEMYQYVDSRLRNVEGQIAQQAVVNAQVTANISCMQQEIATLSGLTKTVIPIGNVCPEPMARYNSWTAPTDDSSAA